MFITFIGVQLITSVINKIKNKNDIINTTNESAGPTIDGRLVVFFEDSLLDVFVLKI